MLVPELPAIGDVTSAVALSSRGEVYVELLARVRGNSDSGAFLAVRNDDAGSTSRTGGVLAGVPFVVKDNIDTAQLHTTGGTGALRGSQPVADATVVRLLREAGAAVLAKANMHELAFGITSNNYVFGPVRNPHDPARSAGGSSGGSAAAVAMGVVPFALGTDTGGSMRIPAAHCGVVGFRPTAGRWPSAGLLRISSTRDTAGVMASRVADIAIVDCVVTQRPELAPTFESLRGLRVGVPRSGFYEDLDPRVAALTEQALSVLADSGAELVEVDLGEVHELDALCGLPIVFYECLREIPQYLSGLTGQHADLSMDQVIAQVGSPDVKGILEGITAQPVPLSGYRESVLVRERLQAAYARAFESHSLLAIAYPTVPLPAPPLGDDDTTEHNGREVSVFMTSIQNTAPGSTAGVPAISLPGGRTAEGLPVGFSLEGPVNSDDRLLGLAALVESCLANAGGRVRESVNRDRPPRTAPP